MIEPYQAIGLVPTMWGIRRREDIRRNLEHLDHLVTASTWLGGLDLPVRLVAVPEGALQGFNDEVLDVDHETFARDCAIDIPGPETDELGRLARKWGVFVMAQAKARHPEFPGRFNGSPLWVEASLDAENTDNRPVRARWPLWQPVRQRIWT